MVAAIFCMDTWMGHEEHFLDGSTAGELLDQFGKYQDLACLSRMASTMGTAEDAQEIKKLDVLLNKWYTGGLKIDDLKDFKLDISVTMNVYTHISFDDAEEELKRMEEFGKAQAEIKKKNDAKAVSQKMFKVV